MNSRHPQQIPSEFLFIKEFSVDFIAQVQILIYNFFHKFWSSFSRLTAKAITAIEPKLQQREPSAIRGLSAGK